MTHMGLIVQQKLQANSFLGAIIGDIVGSVYEWNNIRTMEDDKEIGFALFSITFLPSLAAQVYIWRICM